MEDRASITSREAISGRYFIALCKGRSIDVKEEKLEARKFKAAIRLDGNL